MDSERERVGANDPLSVFFKEIGHIAPTLGLEEIVLGRLGGADAASQVPPLISTKGWVVSSALLFLFIAMGLFLAPNSSGSTTGMLKHMNWLQVPKMAELIDARWVITSLAGISTLLVLDHLIRSRVRALFAL